MRRARSLVQRGFTLVELLIAVLISSVVLLAVYFVFISTTEQFYRQEQVTQMQDGMRFAMDYVKNDLRNAGRLSLVDGEDISTGLCAPVRDADNDAVNAVRLYEGGNNVAILNANSLVPDRLRLLVDASGGLEFTAAPLAAGSTSVRINPVVQQRTEDARRVIGSEARFESVFKAGFYLHITSRAARKFDLVPIGGVAFGAGNPNITLSEATCMECDGGCVVTPIQLVEYRIDGDGTINDGDGNASPKTDLVRAVLDARDGEDLSSLRMAEFAVNLQVWGTYDSRGSPGAAPRIEADPNPHDAIGNWTPAPNTESDILNDRPERLRALNVVLATRTPREDERHVLQVPAANTWASRPEDQLWFELDNGIPGLARVATLRAEVETPNLNRGL